MTGLFNNGSRSGTSSTSPNAQIGGLPAGPGVSSGGFADDGARRMPSASDKVARENSRNKRLRLSASSGRQSTDLSGTRAYVNSFLGGVQ